jgi:hypothetical protein
MRTDAHEENPAFRQVKVEGNKGNYIVTGETRVSKGFFFYSVENGHVEYINEKQVVTMKGGADWHTFQIQIHLLEETLPKNGSLLLNLYQKSKTGEIIHSYPLVLEQFY